jgi:hypothetical protein
MRPENDFQVLFQPLFKPSTALALGTQLDFLLNFRQSDDAHPPIVLGQNIRIDQEPTHVRSTGRG